MSTVRNSQFVFKQAQPGAERRLRELTRRERDVLMGMLMPELAKLTAARLGINVRTVESHRARIRAKLGMSNAQLLKEFGALDVVPANHNDILPHSFIGLGKDRVSRRGAASFDIADVFRFSGVVNPDTITVMMVLGMDLSAKGYLLLPVWLQDELQTLDYPSATTQMPLEMAMSYGLYLALSTRTEIALSGDPGAWDESWGVLEGASRAA